MIVKTSEDMSSPLLTQVLNEFREKFETNIWKELPYGYVSINAEIESFLSDVIEKVERETLKEVNIKFSEACSDNAECEMDYHGKNPHLSGLKLQFLAELHNMQKRSLESKSIEPKK